MSISINTGTEKLVRTYGPFHLSQLESRDESKSLVDDFRLVHDELVKCWEERLDVAREILGLKGRENWAEVELVKEIRRFNLEILMSVEKDRSHPVYRRYFPDGLKGYTKTLDDRRESVENALYLLTQEEGDLAGEIRDRLADAYHGWTRTRTDLAEAKNRRDQARSREKLAKEKWIDVYRMSRIRLMAIYDRNRDVVRAFFYRQPTRKTHDDSVSPEVSTETSK